MSGIGDVRPPEVRPTESVTTLTTLKEETAARPAAVPEAMDPPDGSLSAKPNMSPVPLPTEAPQPMTPDNGQAAARAMQMMVTINVQTSRALVLTELKPPETKDVKQQDYKRDHRSTGRRDKLSAIDGEEEHPAPEQGKQHPGDNPSADETQDAHSAAILELLELLKSGEPLKPETRERVQRFLETGAAALVTGAPTRFRGPFRI